MLANTPNPDSDSSPGMYRKDASVLPVRHSPVRLLVSDDTPDIQKIYRLLLPRFGFDVITTPGGYGITTINLCRLYLPDLVICDINKPDMSGYDVCLAIRRDPLTKHIPVLIVSAMYETLDRRRGHAAGVNEYIVKPFLFEGLLNHIDALLPVSGSWLH